MTLTYGDYEIDEGAIPAGNLQWMLQRTLRRLMGNQVDAADQGAGERSGPGGVPRSQ
jgi:hypothetical protein